MIKSGAKERQAALDEGRVTKEGIPIIDVVADGCWSKRSYKTNYSALSGAAAIVRKRFVGSNFAEIMYMVSVFHLSVGSPNDSSYVLRARNVQIQSPSQLEKKLARILDRAHSSPACTRLSRDARAQRRVDTPTTAFSNVVDTSFDDENCFDYFWLKKSPLPSVDYKESTYTFDRVLSRKSFALSTVCTDVCPRILDRLFYRLSGYGGQLPSPAPLPLLGAPMSDIEAARPRFMWLSMFGVMISFALVLEDGWVELLQIFYRQLGVCFVSRQTNSVIAI
ncbi:hypothetical protein EVAR_76950_1 [Eumeta japonica]|uniref:Mutator-like transposase domain-containing protein n=1 Tax=Eumeta variegata TaxID=151549 RepID=A0A4C1SH60_EUMVA|nr:hypothetical protein EVAR_76950_1 [Eumeta japonica]